MENNKNAGVSKLGRILSERMQKEGEKPLVLDFGVIQSDMSLKTNTFARPIPKKDYSVCRQLTLGATGSTITTATATTHEHSGGTHGGHEEGDGSHTHTGGSHTHPVPLPEKMRSLKPGDRVLVAWVQDEAVVIDIVLSA